LRRFDSVLHRFRSQTDRKNGVHLVFHPPLVQVTPRVFSPPFPEGFFMPGAIPRRRFPDESHLVARFHGELLPFDERQDPVP
jgi:hypothetical protein